MSNNKCFSTYDVRGYTVSLDEQTWHRHICVGHPEMEYYFKEVQDTVEAPMYIIQSSVKATSNLYVNPLPYRDLFVKVIVDFHKSEDEGVIRTALLQKNLSSADKSGGVLYADPKRSPKFPL